MAGICRTAKKTLDRVNVEPVEATYNLFADVTWITISCARCASSTAILSNGFIDILTFESSTPETSDVTRAFTL